MKKTTLIIMMLLLCISFVSAYSYRGYEVAWQDNSEDNATVTGAGWVNTNAAALFYTQSQKYAGTNGTNQTVGGYNYNKVSLSMMANSTYNITWYYYIPSGSLETANSNYGIEYGNDAVVTYFHIRNGGGCNKTQYCYNNGGWNDTGVTANFDSWQKWTIQVTMPTRTFKWYINDTFIASGTLASSGNTLYFKNSLTGKPATFDEIMVWNATIESPPPPNTEYIIFNSQTPADISSTSFFSQKANISYNISILLQNYTVSPFLNWSVNNTPNNCWTYVNGSVGYCGFQNLKYTGNSSNTSYYWDTLSDNSIYPASYNINETIMENTVHDNNLLSSNDLIAINLLNISNSTTYNFFELMINVTAGNSLIYYCNNSYFDKSTKNPSLSTDCVEFATFSSNSYNHTHNASKHNVFGLPIINGSVGNVKVTSNSYFIIDGTVSSAINIGYLNIDIDRTGVTKTSINNGNTWTNQVYPIDAHIHQYTGLETFVYQACTKNSTQSNCSVFRTDFIDIGRNNPSAPIVLIPNVSTSFNRYLNITYLGSQAFNSSIRYYNITLYNADLSFNSTIRNNNSLNLSYLWDSYDTNLSVNTNYYIGVQAYDLDGLSSIGYSYPFNVSTNAILTIGLYDAINITKPISNFSVNFTYSGNNYYYNTTNGSITFYIAKNNTYNFVFNPQNYSIMNFTDTFNNTVNVKNYTIYTTNSILFTFFDEETNTLLNTTTVTLDVILTGTSNISQRNTTTTGSLYLDFLTPGTYTIRYFANNYFQRFYYFNLSDRSFTALNLTLLSGNSSTLVTFTVYDNLGNLVEDVIIKILKFNPSTGNFEINQILTTNFEGKGVAPMLINSEYYKFILEYNGVSVLSTDATYVYGSTLTFYITLTDAILEEYFNEYGLTGTINYSTSLSTASFNYNDVSNTITQACFKAYTQGTSIKTLYNSSCQASASGTLYLPISNTTGVYYLYGILTKGGVDYQVASYIVNNQVTIPDDNKQLSTFLIAVLLIVIIFIGFWNIIISIILTSFGILIASITGLIILPLTIAIPVFVAGLIVSYIIGVKR